MELLSTSEYMAVLATHGIGRDPRYPRGYQLSFAGAVEEAWRTVDLPADPRALASFAHAVLTAAAPTAESFIVVPSQDGDWAAGAGIPLCGELIAVVARGAGVPAGFVGAIRLELREPALIALVAATLAFSAHTGDDLYVVPSDGRCILKTDHHAQFAADFRTLADREEFTMRLGPTGFDTDPADPAAHDRERSG